MLAILCAVLLWLFTEMALSKIFNITAHQIPIARMLMLFLVIQVLFELPGLAIDAVLSGIQRFDIVAVMDALKDVLFFIAVYFFLQKNANVLFIGFFALMNSIVYCVALTVIAIKVLPELRFTRKVTRSIINELSLFTKDLFIIRVNGIIYNHMDKWIIGACLSTEMLTHYDIANRIHSMALIFMGFSIASFLPAASALNARDEKEQLRTLFIKGTKYTLAISIPTTFFLFFLSKPIIEQWISPDYSAIASYARLFLLYAMFWPIILVGWEMLIGMNKTQIMVKIQIVSVLVNLVLSYVLVHVIGIAGVITGTLIGNLIAFILYVRLILKEFDLGISDLMHQIILKTYPNVIVSSCVVLLIVMARYPRSLVDIVLYAIPFYVSYYALFYWYGMDRDERSGILALAKAWVGK
jgi:O-antigen/teichoic acid export membrane protein